MSEYECPKCGGELDSQPAYAGNLLCVSEVQWFSKDYLNGYWTRDREEQEKRCDGCGCDKNEYECGNYVVRPGGAIGRGDFRCSLWEAK